MANEQDTLGIILESSSEGTGFQDVQQDIKKTEQEASDSAKKIEADWQESFAKIRNVSAVAFAAVGAAIGLSIREAAGGEAAMAAYQSSVRRAGGDAEAFGEQIDEAAMRLQRLTGIADDEFIEVAARMTDVTGDAAGSIDKLGLVADLAAARKIDLASAGDMVARAMEGEIGMLSRMLPGLQEQIAALGENADKADIAAIIFERLAVFEGAAADAANTTAGQFKILQQEVSSTTEAVGGAFLESVRGSTEGLTGVVRGIGDWAKEHTLLVSVIGGGALTVSGFLMVATGIGAVLPSLTTGLAAMNTALAVTRGLLLTIPGWGWAIAGATAIVGLTVAIADFETEVDDTPEKIGKLEKSFRDFSPAVADATSAVNDFSHVTAEELEEAAKNEMMALDGMTAELYAYYDAMEKMSGPEGQAFLKQFGDVKTNIDLLNATPLKPLKFPIILDTPEISDIGSLIPQELPQVDLSWMNDVYLAAKEAGIDFHTAMEITNTSTTLQEGLNRVQAYKTEEQAFMQHTAFMQSAFSTMTDSFTNMEMTGKQRREAIWNSLRTAFIRQIGAQVQAHLFGELAKQHATAATGVAQKASFAQSLAASVAHGAKEIGLALQTAAARIYAFYASLGPFGIPAAVGTIAGIYTAVRGLKFQSGGIVPGSGYGDRVPAMLEPGEFVINRSATQQNRSTLEAINSGKSGGATMQNVFNFALDGEGLSLQRKLEIQDFVENMLPSAIERALDNRRFSASFAL